MKFIYRIFIEIRFRKLKWSLLAANKPSHGPRAHWFHNNTKVLNFHSSKYENIFLMREPHAVDI